MTPEQLHCIDLDQPGLEGFRQFISAWLVRGEGYTAVVDPGPLSSVPRLIEELRLRQVEHLDYVLLTHIHIDHAGGTGALLQEFPEAKVICHPQGVRHLVDPGKLWAGSRKVLGATAEAYGEIVPVPESSIGFEEEIGTTGIRSFLTPGHAPHHCCYLEGDLLFGGEVAGVHCPVDDGIYMRPATPPPFFPDTATESLDRMIDLAPRYLVIAHYGLVEPALDYLRIGRSQLQLWLRGAAETFGPSSERDEAMIRWLLDRDPHFRLNDRLPPDIRQRERIFVGNTVRGMDDYLGRLSAAEREAICRSQSALGSL